MYHSSLVDRDLLPHACKVVLMVCMGGFFGSEGGYL